MTNHDKTLRLHFPQWQGGNNPAYYFGSRLLAFLAPAPKGLVEEIAVQPPTNTPLPEERNMVGRSVLKRQLIATQRVLDQHKPDRIVILGGDCLVDLAPFAYLNERYEGKLGVLWIDAHPDVMTPNDFNHAHAMVLGNLLGEGDADFRDTVATPLRSENVMLAGLGKTLDVEQDFIRRHKIATVAPESLNRSSEGVIDWLQRQGIQKLAIHLDLDVLDPALFHSVLFADPDASEGAFDGITQGGMTLEAVQRLISDVAAHTDVVGLGITEHLPWEAIKLSQLLSRLPLLGE